MEGDGGNECDDESRKRGGGCSHATLSAHGATPGISGSGSAPEREQDIEDACGAQAKRGDEQADKSREAVGGDNATEEGEQVGGLREE